MRGSRLIRGPMYETTFYSPLLCLLMRFDPEKGALCHNGELRAITAGKTGGNAVEKRLCRRHGVNFAGNGYPESDMPSLGQGESLVLP